MKPVSLPPLVSRRAFSLVELLVVVAIVGALTGLLLPAVQNARESARRSECGQRMRQIAVALHNYETARGHLPPGSVARPYQADPNTPHTFYRWSALAHALPYMEQGAVHGQLDLDVPLYRADFRVSPENSEIIKTIIPNFLCPSDRGERVAPAFGPTNYALCAGDGADGGTPFDASGVFYANSNTRYADVSDGASNTVWLSEAALGETPPPLTPRTAVDPRLVYAFGRQAPLTVEGCEASAVWNLSDPPGFAWANGEFRSALYNHRTAPNSPELDCISAVTIGPLETKYAAYGWRTARSYHPGGVNASLADGSVRFVRDDVNLEIWQALSTRAGEEATAGD